MKKKIIATIVLVALIASSASLNADCTMTNQPGVNGWCAVETNEEGDIIDYYCQDEAPWKNSNGNNLPAHCILLPT